MPGGFLAVLDSIYTGLSTDFVQKSQILTFVLGWTWAVAMFQACVFLSGPGAQSQLFKVDAFEEEDGIACASLCPILGGDKPR